MRTTSNPTLNRRTFLAPTGAAMGAWLMKDSPALVAQAGSAVSTKPTLGMRPRRWFEDAWRRAVIDMHIPDWDAKFLSEFNADRYVEALVQSRAQSIVCYAHSHVGLFNFPTKVGRQHAGVKGRGH